MLVIFDLDGTLVDSLQDLANATEYALKQLNLPSHPLDAYKYFVGNGVKKLIERALGDQHTHLYSTARAYFDAYYHEHCLDYTPEYEGISDLLKALKDAGHIIGVVTNKPDDLAKKICLGRFGNILDFVNGQVDAIPVKPNPYFLIEAMKKYHFDEKTTYMIGDSDVDIQTGHQAKVNTIGVTWGNRTREELEANKASEVVDDVKSLKTLLLGE